MPVTWDIQGSIILVTLSENYSFNEPVEAVEAAIAAPTFRAGMSLLIDGRRSKVSRSSDEFRERAHWMAWLVLQGFSPRFAIVINSEIHQYGLARMASIHLENKNMELQIFRDVEEARRWLEVVNPPRDVVRSTSG